MANAREVATRKDVLWLPDPRNRDRMTFFSAINENAPKEVENLWKSVESDPAGIEGTIREWAFKHHLAKENHKESQWVLNELRDTAEGWLYRAGLRRSMARAPFDGRYEISNRTLFDLPWPPPSNHPAARRPSGLDWTLADVKRDQKRVIVEAQREKYARTTGEGIEVQRQYYRTDTNPDGRAHEAAGWDPTTETEDAFRARVERYIKSVVKASEESGLRKRTADPVQAFSQDDFDLLARHRVLGEPHSQLAQEVNKDATMVRDHLARLSNWLGLPRLSRGRPRKRRHSQK